LSKGRFLVLDPSDSPVGLLADARDWTLLVRSSTKLEVQLTGVNCVKEICALLLLLDVSVDEERISLRVDVFHHDLKSVEAASLGDLDFSTETLEEVLIDNAIGGCEESKYVRNEVTLIIVQTIVPVMKIFGKINLLGGPE
jgi:hypothetical protein